MSFLRSRAYQLLLAAIVAFGLAVGAGTVWFYHEFLRDLPDLRGIEDDSAALLAAAEALEAPEPLTADRDQIIAAVTAISATSSAMVAGLRTSDSGEARQSALVAYGNAVREFQLLVAVIVEATTPSP